jgi:hypothetical protein
LNGGAHIRQDILFLQRLREEGVDRRSWLWGQFGQGEPQRVGHRQFSGDPCGKGPLLKRVRVDKGLDGEDRRLRQLQPSIVALDSRPGQEQLGRAGFQAFDTLLYSRFFEPAVPMQRDRATNGMVGAVALRAMLHL